MKILCCCLLLLAFSCNDSVKPSGECTPMRNSDAGLELVYPVSGGPFTVGSTVTVRWKVNPEIVDAIILQVNTGGPWYNILGRGMAIPSTGNLLCMDTSWVVGNEYDNVNYNASGTVRVRVAWYNHENEESDESGLITINNP